MPIIILTKKISFVNGIITWWGIPHKNLLAKRERSDWRSQKEMKRRQPFWLRPQGLDHTTTNTSRLIEQSELGQRGIFNW